MDQLEQTLKPFFDLLPEGARSYGMFILAGIVLVGLLVVVLLVRGTWRTLFGRTKPGGAEPGGAESDREFQERLASYPPPRPPGDLQLTVYHVPVRLRLVVVAPAGKDHQVDATAIERLLDQVVPGLGAVAEQDRPRIRVWPAQLSHHGFAATFYRRTLVPEGEGHPSPWVLLAGRAQMGPQYVLLGVALLAGQPNTLGQRELDPNQWVDVLRLKKQDS